MGFATEQQPFSITDLQQQLTSTDQKTVKRTLKEIYRNKLVNNEAQDLYNTLLLEHAENNKRHEKIAVKLIRLQKLNPRERDFKAIESIAKNSTKKIAKEAVDYVITYQSTKNYKKYVTRALDNTQKETNLNKFLIANLWSQNEINLIYTLKTLDLLAFIDVETTDAMYEFVKFQIETYKMNKSAVNLDYIDDMLVILGKSGNKKYLPIYDNAISTFSKKRRYTKIKNNLLRHMDKPTFRNGDEIISYYISHLGEEYDVKSNNKILKSAHATGIQSPELWEKAHKNLIKALEKNEKSGAWAAKSIASSGNLEYKPTLDAVVSRPVENKNISNPNAVNKSIHKHASNAASKIAGFNFWFQAIDDMRNNIYDLSEEERHYLSLTASPIWRIKFLGIKWITLNRYKNPVAMEFLAKVLKHQYSNAPRQGNHDIVTAALLANWLGAFCKADCIPHLEATVNSSPHQEVGAHIKNALKKIKKKNPAG